MHRVALVVDPSPALLAPLVRGLADAGYDVAFSAPGGAERRLVRELRRRRRRGLALDRALAADVIVGRVRDEFGRLDLVVLEPGRAESSPELHASRGGTEVGPHGSSAVGAARVTLELLGESGGSIVRLLRPALDDGSTRLEAPDIASTRALRRSLGARVRVNGVAVPRPTADGLGTDRTAASVVRAVLWLAGTDHLNGEVVSLGGDGRDSVARGGLDR